MILHIPHASLTIPEELRHQFVLTVAELEAEQLLLTDRYTDELFSLPGAGVVLFPVSRLLVDVERFPDDEQEPMSKKGMGMIYTHTAHGQKLRRDLESFERRHLRTYYYEGHHRRFEDEVNKELTKNGRALIVDCHSFPSSPLPSDRDQSMPRPDFCIGADPFHTPETLAVPILEELERQGLSVTMNRPYEGTIVPSGFYRKDRRVLSVMIEVSRRLYMEEATGAKNGNFEKTKALVQALLRTIARY